MKGFMKGCAWAALILIVLGFALTFIGGTYEGSEMVSDVVNKVTDGKVQFDLDGITDWGMSLGEDVADEVSSGVEGVLEELDEGVFAELGNTVNYDIDDAAIFNDAFEIYTDDVQIDFQGKAVKKLNVEVGGCDFHVEESTDGEFKITAENAKKVQGYIEEETLYVKATNKTIVDGNDNTCDIILIIPAGYTFEKIDMEIGAGRMALCNLQAEDMELEVGAGKIETKELQADTLKASAGVGEIIIGKMQVTKLDAKVGMGNLKAFGQVSEMVSAECAMGNITLEIDGAQTDYNYSVEGGMGKIEIGEDSYNGVTNEQSINNGADSKMEIECAVGNIQIEFTE